jgi:zinc protease
VDSETQIIEYDLANGLHVILLPQHHVPLVAVNVWYRVGSKDEDPKRTGFAHLFEHMMFQGSANVPKLGHFRHIQDVGGTLNATTNQDRTNYFETLPSSHLGLGLWLESDRMFALNVTQENFENQRAVVKEERRQRYDNRPYGTVYENLLHHVFPSSGYHWSTIGSMLHLDEATLEEVVDFHHSHYLPNNAALAIVGSFNEAEARRLIDLFFGSIPSGPLQPRIEQIVEPLHEQARVEMTDAVALTLVTIAFQTPQAFTKESYALDIASDILSAGRSSRFYQRLVYKEKIAKEVSTYNVSNEKAGLFVIQAMVHASSTPEDVERVIWEELHLLLDQGVNEMELQKALNNEESDYIRHLIPLANQADHLQRARAFTGDTLNAFRDLEMLRAVTRDEVQRAAQRYLRESIAVVLRVSAKEPVVAMAAEPVL